MSRFVGIDPGSQGGISIIDSMPDGGINLFTQPLSKLTLTELAAFLKTATTGTASVVIEKVWVMPRGDGAKAATTFMRKTGQLEGILAACGVVPKQVAPNTWHRMFGASSDKKRNQALARELFPHAHIISETADSVLLAEYCRRINAGAGVLRKDLESKKGVLDD